MQTDDRSRGALDSEDPPSHPARPVMPGTDPIAILPYPAALIDGTGRIELVNEAWDHAAIRGGADPVGRSPGAWPTQRGRFCATRARRR